MKPGTKFSDLFISWNMRRRTLLTALKRQSRRERFSRKKCRSSASIVKTQCRCVCTLNQFERHGIRAFLTVFHTAGRAEAAFAAERNEFEHPTFSTGVHGTAKGRVTTVNHLVDIADDSLSGI